MLNSITMLDRADVPNPAKYAWLFLYNEPLAGNSDMGRVPGSTTVRVPYPRGFKRVFWRNKMRNKAARRLGLNRRVAKAAVKRRQG